MKVLITGSNGVIGTEVRSQLKFLGHETFGTHRPGHKFEKSIEIAPWRIIDCSEKFDVIIHLAGVYKNGLNVSDQRDVFESNIGLTSSIADYCASTETPLVFTGSFFEMAPSEFQPWSYYASSKKYASDLIINRSNQREFKFTKLYLYDNYGKNLSRQKFIDLILRQCKEKRGPIKLSEGKQKQNLTHISDVASAIVLASTKLVSDDRFENYYQVKSQEELTLRQIVAEIEEVSETQLEIDWGALPYREKEVFEIWDSSPNLPNWNPHMNFNKFLLDFFEVNRDD